MAMLGIWGEKDTKFEMSELDLEHWFSNMNPSSKTHPKNQLAKERCPISLYSQDLT